MGKQVQNNFVNGGCRQSSLSHVLCLISALCLTFSSTANAQAEKFGDRIDLSDLSNLLSDVRLISPTDLQSQRISNDGKFVVFIADRDTDSVFELFSVPIGGGTLTKLNAALSSNQDIDDFAISPNSQRVVYVGDQTTEFQHELYSVPITGGLPVKISGAIQPSGDVLGATGFLISPDGQFVVYRADQEVDNQTELYSVPIEGGTVQKLSGTMVPNGDVQSTSNDVRISSDSQRVVFLADRVTDGFIELFSVPISGGNPVKLNGALPENADVNDDFLITPDNTKVIYEADQATFGKDELFAVGIGGGVPTALTSGMQVDGANFGINGNETALVTPDSSRVVFRADFQTDGVVELFSVPITGGAPTKLSPLLQSGGNVSTNTVMSPDGTTLVFSATSSGGSSNELYSVPTTGAQPAQKISGTMVAGGGVSTLTGNTKFTADGQDVLFVADAEVDGDLNLYKVAADGSGSRLRLNQPIPLDGPTGIASSSSPGGTFQISPDGREVLYRCRCRADEPNQTELFLVGINGGTPERINDELPDQNAGIDRANFSPDGQFIVFLGDQEILGQDRLSSVKRVEDELCVPVKTNNGKLALICI